MGRFIFRRTLWMLLVLIVVSGITFVLMHQIPGGPWAREKKLTDQIIENLNKKYHLDDPLYVQYVHYMYDVLVPTITTGEFKKTVESDYLINIPLFVGNDAHLRWMSFGPSMTKRNRTVNDFFRDFLPVSAQLGITALIISSCIGIPLGIIAALKRNTMYDYTGMGVAILGVSVPVITLGPILRYIFGVQLGWVPPTGWGEFNYFFFPADWASFKQLLLPAFALGFAYSALLARLTRASLLQVLDEDYIRTARAKGLRQNTVVITHAMKNALIPVVTVLGPLFAALVTGTFVTEQIFAIPGMGRHFIQSIGDRDYSVIMGTVLLYAVFLVIANFAVDIVYAWLDPRIRYD